MEANWKKQQGEGFSFSYPPNWNFGVLPDAPGEGYYLFLPGQKKGTNIVILRITEKKEDISVVEQEMLRQIENSPKVTSSTVLDTSRIQVGGHEAVSIRHTANTTASNKIEGSQIGVLLPDGQVLAFTLTVFNDTDFGSVFPVFIRLIESVVIAE